MILTNEQLDILTHITSPRGIGLTLIDSVAGSGKTTMLVAIAKNIPHRQGLYLAYNKAIATEAQRKFPSTTACSTTHSLAYQAVVKPYKLQVKNNFSFTYRDIQERIPYDEKLEVVNTIREYCLSRFVLFDDFATEYSIPGKTTKLCKQYLDLMQNGKIDTTHEFYLKYFHILLATGQIEYDTFDFIMLDEAGDLNEVTLEIFRLLPAIRKIAVGDPFQNIYTFNHTINCFKVLKDEGTIFRMSQSFRVADHIAPRIEKFCQKYLDSDMEFKGVSLSNSEIQTRGFLTRTNSTLIGKMIDLNQQGIQYGLVRSVHEIFRIPMMLCNLKYQGFITDPAYKHLQVDVDTWYEDSAIREQYKTTLSYIMNLYEEDFQLQQAIRLVLRHTKIGIMNAYAEAKKHQNSKQSYILATAHSCKGMEFDEVTLGDDMNESITDILMKFIDEEEPTLSITETESLNLYYVACTRASKLLNNARYL